MKLFHGSTVEKKIVSRIEKIVNQIEMGSFSIRKTAQIAQTSTTFVNRYNPECVIKIKLLQRNFREKIPINKKIYQRGLIEVGAERCLKQGLIPTIYSIKKAVGFPAILQKGIFV